MQIDRQQLVSIGASHLCQRLLAWQQKHLMQTSFSIKEFPGLAREALHHGLSSQRGIAAWSLAWLFRLRPGEDTELSLHSLLNTPTIGAMERTLLLEIWLWTQNPGSPGTPSAGQCVGLSSLQAALGQCLSGTNARERSQQALQEAARAWRLACYCLVQPLERELPALCAALSGLPTGVGQVLMQDALALQNCMRPLLQSLQDTVNHLPARAPEPHPDQAQPGKLSPDPLDEPCAPTTLAGAVQSLNTCWQQLEQQTRHALPRLIETLETGLDNAQERIALSAFASLERAQLHLTHITFLVQSLPSACAGAIACARVAGLLIDEGCLPELEALRLKLLKQSSATPGVEGNSSPWYSALSNLPKDFPLARALPVEPRKANSDPLRGRTSLDIALAQATLFNALQALENILKPVLKTFIELITAEHGHGDEPSPILVQYANQLNSAMTRFDEQIAKLNTLIVELDHCELPGLALTAVFDDVQQSLQTINRSEQNLAGLSSLQSSAREDLQRYSSLLSQNLRESTELLAALATP